MCRSPPGCFFALGPLAQVGGRQRYCLGGLPLQWTVISEVLGVEHGQRQSCGADSWEGRAVWVLPHGGCCKGQEQRMWSGGDREGETCRMRSQSHDVMVSADGTARTDASRS